MGVGGGKASEVLDVLMVSTDDVSLPFEIAEQVEELSCGGIGRSAILVHHDGLCLLDAILHASLFPTRGTFMPWTAFCSLFLRLYS